MTNAINAALAYWILFRVIFGDNINTRYVDDGEDDFAFVRRPSWKAKDYYFEAADRAWKLQLLMIL
jgi:hypothetical protein